MSFPVVTLTVWSDFAPTKEHMDGFIAEREAQLEIWKQEGKTDNIITFNDPEERSPAFEKVELRRHWSDIAAANAFVDFLNEMSQKYDLKIKVNKVEH